MLKLFNNALKISLSLYCLMSSCIVNAESPVSIKEDKPNYSQDIQYPQDFQSADINAAIRDFIAKNQSVFRKSLKEDAKTPARAPGKTSLDIKYSIPFKSKKALSIRFDISTYHRGAAHPANTVSVLNFVNGKRVLLPDLFIPKSNYLITLSDYCNKQITAKKISDKDWIKEGTAPVIANYDIWYFTQKGIAVVFDTYQVAAYVYGPQIIEIPQPMISSLIKPSIKKILWSLND